MEKGLRKVLSVFLCFSIILSLFNLTVFAETENNNAKSFYLETEVFDYGQDVTKVIIEIGEEIDNSSLSKDTFTVSAKNLSPVDGKVIYEGTRSITDIKVTDETGKATSSGNYITLNLRHGFNIDGASALVYDEKLKRNFNLELNYTVKQEKDITTKNNKIINGSYSMAGMRNLLVDEFEKLTSDSGLNYRMYTPVIEAEKYPLIIWLHGAGEGGADNNVQIEANKGGVGFITEQAQKIYGGAYVVSPQCPVAWHTDDKGEKVNKSVYTNQVVSLIEEVIENNDKIDESRVYIGGCSAGGYMTWQTIIAAPELFAAAFPICAAYDPTPSDLEKVIDIPIWLVHSADDTSVTPQNSRFAYGGLRALGGNVKYTEYENVKVGINKYNGHWSWIYVLNNLYDDNYGITIMEWMANQKLK